ncbi:MAG: YadA-like family protein [Bdellovibrionales bacterium]
MSVRLLVCSLLCCVVALAGFLPARAYAQNAVDNTNAVATSLNAGTGTATSIGNSAGTTVNGPATINGTLSQTGNTSINTSGVGTTTIGDSVNTTNIQSITTNIGAGTDSNAINIGNLNATNTINGTTSINNNVNANTNINTGSTSGNVSIGGTGNTTTIQSAVARIGAGSSSTSTTIGNSVSGTLVQLQSNNASVSVNSTSVGSGITGGTATVGSGTTSSQSYLANSGGAGVQIGSNGHLTSATTSEATAAMVVTNGIGNMHGFVVTEHAAVVSGGTTSNSMTINDDGASFANSDTGAPIKVTGVANGTSQYDAANYGQVSRLTSSVNDLDNKVDTLHKNMAGGIASVAAMSALPGLEKGKKYAIGMGTGYFDSQAGFALGFIGRFNKKVVGRIGLAMSPTSPETNTVANAGISYAW